MLDALSQPPRPFRARDIVPACVALVAVICAGPILFRVCFVPGWEDTVSFGDARAVRELLTSGFDPNMTTRHGHIPLMALAIGTPDETAKVGAFLEAGADPNAYLPRGYTSLHQAASTGTAETCRLLLAAGANPRARNDRGKTPLDRARDRPDPEVRAAFGLPGATSESEG
jgi:hypothetical protein